MINKSFNELTPQDITSSYQANVIGVMQIIQAALPKVLEKITDFALNSHQWINGKIIPVSLSTPLFSLFHFYQNIITSKTVAKQQHFNSPSFLS